MFVLAAADTLAGVAQTASKVTCTTFGMELNGTTETYKVLDQRQLANSAATIYTAPASTVAFVKSITVVNTDTVTQTFQLFRGGTAQANAITPVFTLLPGGCAVFEDGLGWTFYNSAGQQLQSQYAVVPPAKNWGISGCKAETMDRNLCPEVNTVAGTTGQIRLQAIWLEAGTVVSNIVFCTATTAAGTPTNYCFGLYSSTGTMLATTADQTSTAWAAITMKTLAVTTPYTVPTAGLYYLAFMMKATTVATLKGGTAKTDGVLGFTTPLLQGISATAYVSGTAPAGVTLPAAKNTASIWGCVT